MIVPHNNSCDDAEWLAFGSVPCRVLVGEIGDAVLGGFGLLKEKCVREEVTQFLF